MTPAEVSALTPWVFTYVGMVAVLILRHRVVTGQWPWIH